MNEIFLLSWILLMSPFDGLFLFWVLRTKLSSESLENVARSALPDPALQLAKRTR